MPKHAKARLRLTQKQQAVLEALLAGNSATQAAKIAGVLLSTVSEWQNLPHFERALNAGRAERIAHATAMINLAVPHAVSTLLEILKDKKSKPTARIAAARDILDRAGIVAVTRLEVQPVSVAATLTDRELEDAIRAEYLRIEARAEVVDVAPEEPCAEE